MSAAAAPTQPLPGKEAGLFKQILRLHEMKQYKKAIKTADQILKKFPEHGETLAMKGLCLRSAAPDSDKEKKEEAYELVRKGVKCDLKSHVCWHVYGLLYRQDREYKEAIKCYLNALRIDKENIQILRDLALLQIQMRDLQGFVDTRQQLLAVKPSNRSHWITFAVAHHMNGNHDLAVQVLEQFEATLDEVPASETYEHSEMLMFAATCLAEGGRHGDALAYLEKRKDKIKDRLGLAELTASLLLRLGRGEEAAAAYRKLLAVNPNNYKMHDGLRQALGLEAKPEEGGALTEEQRAALTRLYDELQAEFPGSSACRRIPLDFKVGDAFRAAADAYLRRGLTRGVPSLFVDVRPLLADPVKCFVVQSLLEGYRDSLRSSGAYPPLSGAPADAPPPQPESPQTLVWVLLFLARFYDRKGRLGEALAHINSALEHTPTLIELYVAKAKILKHAGDLEGAAHMAESARRLDLQDRYLNSVAVKALLAAGHTAAADRTAALFTRDGDAAAAYSLYDMQHMWYEVAAGRAHAAGAWPGGAGPALKKFTAVVKHFADIHEDQFDFHSYCIRKGTLRSYVAMLGMMDRLYGHGFFFKAASGAIRVYLKLHDKPPGAANGADEEALLAAMSPEERKKYKLAKKKEEKEKARKAAEEKEREERERREREKEKDKDKAGKGGKKASAAAAKREPDPDPDGAKLAATPDPLGEAAKLVSQLTAHAGRRLGSHTLAAEVALRRGRLVVALGALRGAAAAAAAEGGAEHPEVHELVVRLALAVRTSPPEHPVVRSVLESGLASLLGASAPSVEAYAEAWRRTHGSASLRHRLAAGCVMVALGRAQPGGQEGQAATARAVAHVLEEDLCASPHDHEEVAEVHRMIRDTWGDTAAAERWRAAAAAAFPHSRYFGGASLMPLEPSYDFENMREAFGKLSF